MCSGHVSRVDHLRSKYLPQGLHAVKDNHMCSVSCTGLVVGRRSMINFILWSISRRCKVHDEG